MSETQTLHVVVPCGAYSASSSPRTLSPSSSAEEPLTTKPPVRRRPKNARPRLRRSLRRRPPRQPRPAAPPLKCSCLGQPRSPTPPQQPTTTPEPMSVAVSATSVLTDCGDLTSAEATCDPPGAVSASTPSPVSVARTSEAAEQSGSGSGSCPQQQRPGGGSVRAERSSSCQPRRSGRGPIRAEQTRSLQQLWPSGASTPLACRLGRWRSGGSVGARRLRHCQQPWPSGHRQRRWPSGGSVAADRFGYFLQRWPSVNLRAERHFRRRRSGRSSKRLVYCDSLDVRQLSLQTNTSKNARDVCKSCCHSSKPSSTHREKSGSVVDTEDNVSKARPRAQSPETQISSYTQAAEDTWSTSNIPGSISKLSASSPEIVDDYQESNSPDRTVSKSALRSHNELNSDAELCSDAELTSDAELSSDTELRSDAASDSSRSSDTIQRQPFNSESSEDDEEEEEEEADVQRALGHSPCWRGESAVEPRAKPPVTMSRQESAWHSCLLSASTVTGVSDCSPIPRPLTSRAGDPSAAAHHSSSASSTTCKALSSSWEPFWEQCRLCHRSILAKAGDAEEAAGAGRKEKPDPQKPARGVPSWFPMSRTASSQESSLRVLVLGKRIRRPSSATTTFRRLKEQDFALDLSSPPRKPAGVKDSKGTERFSVKQKRWFKIEHRNSHAEMASVGWCSGRPLAHQYRPRGRSPTRTSPRPGPGQTAAGASSDDSTESPATPVADQQDKADPAEQGGDNSLSVNCGTGTGTSTGTSEQQDEGRAESAESANTESLSLKDSQLISTARKWEWNFILSKVGANANADADPRITPSRSAKSDAHLEAAAFAERPRDLPAAVPGRKCCGSHSAFFSRQDSMTPSLLAQQSERAAERAGDFSTGVGLSIAPYTTDGSRGESVVQPPTTPQKPTQRRGKRNTLGRCNALGRYRYNTAGIHGAPNASRGTRGPGLNDDDDTGKSIRRSALAESKPVLAEFPEQADPTRPPGKNVAAASAERGSETMMLLGTPFPVPARRCTTITYDFFPGKIHTTPVENKLLNAWVAKRTNHRPSRDATIQEPARFRCGKFEDPSYGDVFRAQEAREKLSRLLAGKLKGRNNLAEPSGLFIVHGIGKDFCSKVDVAARKTLTKKSPQAPQPTVTGVPGQPKGSRQRIPSTTTTQNRSPSGKQTPQKGVPGSLVGSLSNPETKKVLPPEKKTARKGVPVSVVGSPSNPETKNVSPRGKQTSKKGVSGSVGVSPSNHETKNLSPPGKQPARKGVPASISGSLSNPETLAKKARWSQRTSHQAAAQERPAKPEPKMNAAKGAGTPPRPNPDRAVRSASDVLTKTDSNGLGAWSDGARIWKVGVSRAVDDVGKGVTKPNASNRPLSAALRKLKAIASHAGYGGAGKVVAMETDKNPPAAADAEDSRGRKTYFNLFSNSALYNDFYDEQLVKIFSSMSVSPITSWNSSSTLESEESEEEEEEEEDNTEENKEDSKDVNDEEENEDVKDANDEEKNEEDSKVSNNDEENKDSKSANDEEDNEEDSEDANGKDDNEEDSEDSNDEEDSEETDDEERYEEPVKPLSAAMMKESCRKMKQQSGGELETLTKAISSWNNSMYDRFSRVRRPSWKD